MNCYNNGCRPQDGHGCESRSIEGLFVRHTADGWEIVTDDGERPVVNGAVVRPRPTRDEAEELLRRIVRERIAEVAEEIDGAIYRAVDRLRHLVCEAERCAFAAPDGQLHGCLPFRQEIARLWEDVAGKSCQSLEALTNFLTETVGLLSCDEGAVLRDAAHSCGCGPQDERRSCRRLQPWAERHLPLIEEEMRDLTPLKVE